MPARAISLPRGPYPGLGRRKSYFIHPVVAYGGGTVDHTLDLNFYAFAMSFPRLYEDRHGYVFGNRWDIQKGRRVKVFIHRVVAGGSGDLLADHRLGRRRDNRRCMLRLATHQENSWNRRKSRRRKCSSSHLGVTLHRQTGKWQAQSKTNGKNTYLGLFPSEVEAAVAYNRHAKAVRGRFAVLNRVTPKMLARARQMAQSRLTRSRVRAKRAA